MPISVWYIDLSHISCLQDTNSSGDTLRAHALTDFGPSASLPDGSASPELPSNPPSSQDPPQSFDASAIDSETGAAVQEKQAPPQGGDEQVEDNMGVLEAAAGVFWCPSSFLVQHTVVCQCELDRRVRASKLCSQEIAMS